MLAKKLFDGSEDFDLFTLKFHMLHFIVEDVSKLSALNFFDVSLFKHYNCVIKNVIKTASMPSCCTMEEDVMPMTSSVEIGEKRNNTGGGIRKANLSRENTIINLFNIATSTLASLVHIDNDGRVVLGLQ